MTPAWGWAVEVTPSPDVRELIVDRLWFHGATSIEERPDGSLAAGYPTEHEARWAASAVDGRVVAITDDSWLDVWRAFARPHRVGRLVVQPAWMPAGAPEAGDVVVAIDPGRAFGDGGHPTTAMVLAELERTLRGGERVLDAGCGSGILGITAAVLGAARVEAVDVDPDAVAVTRHNAATNGVAGLVHVSLAPVAQLTGPFDVVCANIGAKALLDLQADLVRLTAPGGRLLLTGVLTGRSDEVSAAYRRAGRVRRVERDGWVLLEVRRGPQAE